MPIRGLLIDLEGVLYQNGRAIEGAVETIRNLQATGTAFRFLTNTTTISRNRVVSAMTDMGFDVDAAAVFTPAIAAGQFLEARNIRRVHLAAPMELAEDFKSFEQVEENPEAIILGDLHTAFTWQRLDGIFRMLQGGAMLIALHKNRYCRRGEALSLDIGPFVAALEYAT
ncbi:MAG: TIGR01458 family HAD-type hydrolase, partial [Rhodospirillaceae bacterium]|nr:TIGR01458 family HAD-type hydrolase [Rhodospirillaceae bacterium]